MSVIKNPINIIEKQYNEYFDKAVSYINKIDILTDKFNTINPDDSDDLMTEINIYINFIKDCYTQFLNRCSFEKISEDTINELSNNYCNDESLNNELEILQNYGVYNKETHKFTALSEDEYKIERKDRINKFIEDRKQYYSNIINKTILEIEEFITKDHFMNEIYLEFKAKQNTNEVYYVYNKYMSMLKNKFNEKKYGSLFIGLIKMANDMQQACDAMLIESYRENFN
jgi:hypothetical protein